MHPGPLRLPRVQAEDDVTRVYSSVVTGNALDIMRGIPDGTIRSVITSPPYWSLRDYAMPGQIGMENDVNDYIDALVSAFAEVRRLLDVLASKLSALRQA